jgi:hypothetical protein
VTVNRKCLIAIFIVFDLLVILAWAPWFTRSQAEAVVERRFEAGWREVTDGCGFNCTGCGVTELQKVPFGYQASIEYACGMLPADDPQYHRFASGLVTFLGTLHGFPQP